MRTPSCTPVFVTFSPITEEVSVNGEVFPVAKALSTAMREPSLQTYLHINVAVQHAVNMLGHVIPKPPEAELELGVWEIYAEAHIGYERMIRARATESQQYNLHGQEFQIDRGHITGWIMVTPQNIKGLRDRTLYVCEKSMLFGMSSGRVLLQNSSLFGRVKNSMLINSSAGFSELDGCRVRDSSVEFCALDNVKVLHSVVKASLGRRALFSSCYVETFTVIDSQLTDVRGTLAGLNFCTISSKELYGVRRSELIEAGDNERMQNSYDSVTLVEFTRMLLSGERESAVLHLRESLLRSPGLQKSGILSELDEPIIEKESAGWAAKTSGSRIVLETSGDPHSKGSVQSLRSAAQTLTNGDTEDDLDDEDDETLPAKGRKQGSQHLCGSQTELDPNDCHGDPQGEEAQ